MSSNETLKAIAARVHLAKHHLSVDEPEECLSYLEGLERVLPKPETRHIVAAKGPISKPPDIDCKRIKEGA